MRQIFSLEWLVIFIWAFGQENYINAQGCGGLYMGSSGSFTSPNYPHNYDNSLSCTYTIDPGSTMVTLIFRYFETEKGFDFVKVYDALNTSMESLSGTYTGLILESASSYQVHFTTDGSVTQSGFKAVWIDAANALGVLGGNAVLSWELHQTGIKEFTVHNIQLGTLVYHVTNYNQVNVADGNLKSRVSFTGNITQSGTGVFEFTLYDVNFEDEGQYGCFIGSQTVKGSRIIGCGQRLQVFETDVVARVGENATLSWRLSQPGTVEFTVMKTGEYILHVTDYNKVTVSDAYKSRAQYTGNVTATGSGVFTFVEYDVVSSGYYRCFTGSPDSNWSQMSECGQRLIILRHLQDPYIVAPHTVTYGRSINLTCYTDAYTPSFSNVAILTTHIIWKKNGILLNNRGRYRISKMNWIYLNNTLTISDVKQEDDEDIYTCQAMVGRTVSNWSDGFVFGKNYIADVDTNYTVMREDNTTLTFYVSQSSRIESVRPRFRTLLTIDTYKVTIYPAYAWRIKIVRLLTSPDENVLQFTLYNLTRTDAGIYTCRGGVRTSPNNHILLFQQDPQEPYIVAPAQYGNDVTLNCYTISRSLPLQYHPLMMSIYWKKNGVRVKSGGRYLITEAGKDRDDGFWNSTLTVSGVRRENFGDRYTCQVREEEGLKSNWSEDYIMGWKQSPLELGNQTNVYEGEDATLTWELPHSKIYIRNPGTIVNLLNTVSGKVSVTETYWQRIKVNLYISSPVNDYLSITLLNVTSADAGSILCHRYTYLSVVPGCRNLLTVFRFQRSYITVEAIARNRLKCNTYFQQWPRNPNLTHSANWRRNGEQVVIAGRYEVTPPIRDNESFWTSQMTISTIGTEDRNDSYSCNLEDENGLATPWSVDFEFLTYGVSQQFPSYTVAYGAGEVLLQWLQPRLEKNIFLQTSHTGETILSFDFERVKIASPYISRYLFGGMVTQSTSNVVFLVLQNVTAADAGNINCYVYDSSTQLQIPQCGTLLVVSEQPSKPTVSSYGPAVAGHPVTLTCNSTSRSLPVGHPLYMNYTWRSNGFQLESGGRHRISGSSLTITNILADDNVGYSCQAVEEDVMSQWSDDYVFNILATADANLLMFAVVGACSTFVVIAVIGTVVFCQAYKKLKRSLDERSVTPPCVEMQPADGSRVNMYDAFETPRAEPNEYKFENNEAFYENI